MELSKSSRHSKITGDFAEHLVLYWLSKYGFECAKVDHTGIDLIAKNPDTDELLGISVKGRSRYTGKEKDSVTIQNSHFEKVEEACNAFGCTPYFAVVVDGGGNSIKVFLLSMAELERVSPNRQTASYWKMTPKHIKAYRDNPNIIMFELNHEIFRWFGKKK